MVPVLTFPAPSFNVAPRQLDVCPPRRTDNIIGIVTVMNPKGKSKAYGHGRGGAPQGNGSAVLGASSVNLTHTLVASGWLLRAPLFHASQEPRVTTHLRTALNLDLRIKSKASHKYLPLTFAEN